MLASIVFTYANPGSKHQITKRIISSVLFFGFCGVCLPVQIVAQRLPARRVEPAICLPRTSVSGINTSRLGRLPDLS
jgi:hypothetical protein